MSMANNVKTLSDMTTGVVVANRAGRHAELAHDLPTRSLRAHLSRLPEPAPAVVEPPLIETDTAPGFSALRQIPVRVRGSGTTSARRAVEGGTRRNAAQPGTAGISRFMSGSLCRKVTASEAGSSVASALPSALRTRSAISWLAAASR